MTHRFTLDNESLKRKFAVYVVVAKGKIDTKLYVGKTGDNRDGCNPIISRCGNHFSYNKIHSQIRNLIPDYENRKYTYLFEHFDDYYENIGKRRMAVDKINEMERWLNQCVQSAINGLSSCRLLNPYEGKASISTAENQRRREFRTEENKQKIIAIVEAMLSEIRDGGTKTAQSII